MGFIATLRKSLGSRQTDPPDGLSLSPTSMPVIVTVEALPPSPFEKVVGFIIIASIATPGIVDGLNAQRRATTSGRSPLDVRGAPM